MSVRKIGIRLNWYPISGGIEYPISRVEVEIQVDIELRFKLIPFFVGFLIQIFFLDGRIDLVNGLKNENQLQTSQKIDGKRRRFNLFYRNDEIGIHKSRFIRRYGLVKKHLAQREQIISLKTLYHCCSVPVVTAPSSPLLSSSAYRPLLWLACRLCLLSTLLSTPHYNDQWQCQRWPSTARQQLFCRPLLTTTDSASHFFPTWFAAGIASWIIQRNWVFTPNPVSWVLSSFGNGPQSWDWHHQLQIPVASFQYCNTSDEIYHPEQLHSPIP